MLLGIAITFFICYNVKNGINRKNQTKEGITTMLSLIRQEQDFSQNSNKAILLMSEFEHFRTVRKGYTLSTDKAEKQFYYNHIQGLLLATIDYLKKGYEPIIINFVSTISNLNDYNSTDVDSYYNLADTDKEYINESIEMLRYYIDIIEQDKDITSLKSAYKSIIDIITELDTDYKCWKCQTEFTDLNIYVW